MTDLQMKWCMGSVPVRHRGGYRKALDGRRPVVAIRQKCLDCMAWQEAEVRRCNIEHCPLWPYRMGRMKRQTAASKAVALCTPPSIGGFRDERP